MAVSQASLDNLGIEEPQPLSTPDPSAPAALDTPPAPVVKVEDQLDRELREAEEAARVEAGQPATTPAAAAPAAPTPPTATPPEQPGQAKLVPLAVAQDERAKRQTAERGEAYWRGRAEALQQTSVAAPATAPAEPVAPQVTPQERLEAIKQERIALAGQYDDGLIRTKEWEERRIALETEQRQLWREIEPPPASAQPSVPIGEQIWEEQQTLRIEKEYPILGQLAQPDLEPLIQLAYREAVREGKPIERSTRGTIELRERVARLATKTYGPGTAPASPTAPVPIGQHTNAGAALLSATHPVDVSSLGAGALAGGLTDEQAVARMSSMNETEQIAFLDSNPQIVQRAVGRTMRG